MQKLKKIMSLILLCFKEPGTLIKGVRYIKGNGVRNFLGNMKRRAAYQAAYCEPAQTKLKFSILIPVYNVELKWLARAIDSIREQLYPNWEICLVDDCSTDKRVTEYLQTIQDKKIKVTCLTKNTGISEATNAAASIATGDYLILMDNDDEIAIDALYEFKLAIDHTGAEILYSDQDIIDMEGSHREPLCKPDWSPDLLLSQMYIGHLLGFKAGLFTKVGGLRSEYNGSQDYDLMLRMSEVTTNIYHVPKVLYSWRAIPTSTAANPASKPYAQTVGQKAIQDHLDRVYGSGNTRVDETQQYFVYDTRYLMKSRPLVSVIIPTKDHVDLLSSAVDSILEKTNYDNYEILILNNRSEEQASLDYFEKVQSQFDNVVVADVDIDFNWSKLNNFGISKAKGEICIFMNNDMKIISPDWMLRLAEKSVQNGVGIVGGLLLYEDSSIQHAGVVVGMGGWADHVFKGMKPVHYGSPFVSPMVTRNVMAVTGACMCVTKDTLSEIGGFDEDFIICGSDIELCIRAVQKGYRNIYDPYVCIFHYESKSRDSYIPEIDFELSAKAYGVYRELGDPYYNVQLDKFSCIPQMQGS